MDEIPVQCDAVMELPDMTCGRGDESIGVESIGAESIAPPKIGILLREAFSVGLEP